MKVSKSKSKTFNVCVGTDSPILWFESLSNQLVTLPNFHLHS